MSVNKQSPKRPGTLDRLFRWLNKVGFRVESKGWAVQFTVLGLIVLALVIIIVVVVALIVGGPTLLPMLA